MLSTGTGGRIWLPARLACAASSALALASMAASGRKGAVRYIGSGSHVYLTAGRRSRFEVDVLAVRFFLLLGLLHQQLELRAAQPARGAQEQGHLARAVADDPFQVRGHLAGQR